jgi:hypothetical protein
MKIGRMLITAAAASLCGCHSSTDETAANIAEAPAAPAANEAQPAIPPPETGPDARTPLGEPKGAIDPKSTEAAGQVVQHYGALIEQDRWNDAANFWGGIEAASSFARELRARGLKHLEIGKPGAPEGAAGSIYVTMPIVFYRGSNRIAADVVLRRVNDIPGSTQAQRRWHIERIEWKS